MNLWLVVSLIESANRDVATYPSHQPHSSDCLLQQIRERSLDRLYNLEEELLSGKGDLMEVLKPLQVSDGMYDLAQSTTPYISPQDNDLRSACGIFRCSDKPQRAACLPDMQWHKTHAFDVHSEMHCNSGG